MQIILGETNSASDRNFETLYLQIRVAYKHESFHKYILLFTVTETTCLIKMLTGKVEYIFEFWRHFMGADYAIFIKACISNYSGPLYL